MKRSLCALWLVGCDAMGARGVQEPARYAENCAACHEAGAADAPRRGDEADWGRRRRRGLPELVQRVRTGTVAMPPRGLCYDCSEAELDALVRYVSGLSEG